MKKIGLGSEMKKRFRQNLFENKIFQVLTVFDVQVAYSFENTYSVLFDNQLKW